MIIGDQNVYGVAFGSGGGWKVGIEAAAPGPANTIPGLPAAVYQVEDIWIYCDAQLPGPGNFVVGMYDVPGGTGTAPVVLVAGTLSVPIAAPAAGAPAWVQYAYAPPRPLIYGGQTISLCCFGDANGVNMYMTGVPAGYAIYTNANVGAWPAMDNPFGAAMPAAPDQCSFYANIRHIPDGQRVPEKQHRLIHGRGM